MLAIQKLMAVEPLDRKAVDEFLRATLVSDRRRTRGGRFVFHGRADQVNLRHFVFGLPSVQPFLRVEGTDLWYHTLEIPAQSCVSGFPNSSDLRSQI